MKIGVLSDTHLKTMSSELGEILIKHLSGADIILHAGDVVETEVLDIFKSQELCLVAGNMDSTAIKQNNPWKRVIPLGRFKIGLIHGWGSPAFIEQRIQREFEEVDCIVFGHTHNPCNRKIGKTLFFNPGSPTDKRFAKANSIGILTIENGLSGEIIYL
jgi:hypothetical protein